MTCKTILFIAQHPPYGSSKSRELLDIALAASAFEQQVSLLFIADGVFILADQQQPDTLQLKDISKTLKLLPMYGVDKLYAQAQALNQRTLTAANTVQIISNLEIQQLINQHDVVINL
jgi:tRNA 2-thiouridine synthesizing protein C